jgi:hypothetical protein
MHLIEVAAPPVHAPGGRKAGLATNARKGLQSTRLSRPIPEMACVFSVSVFTGFLEKKVGLLLS